MNPGPILSIGAPANGSGKTMLAARILEAHPGVFAAVKAITVYRNGRFCPSDGNDCACHHLGGPWKVVDDPETIEAPGTDTGLMTASGARTVLWGLAMEGAHAMLWRDLTVRLPEGVPVVLEGTKIAAPAGPAGRVFVLDPAVPGHRWKDGTEAVVRAADVVVVNHHRDGREVDANLAWLADVLEVAWEEAGVDGPLRVEGELTRPLASWADDGLARWLETAILCAS